MNSLAKKPMIFFLAALTFTGIACSNNNSSSFVSSNQTGNESLYDKYGGEPTIQKIVDDVVTSVTADPVTAPYFVVVDQPGHDTTDRLKSCLDLQFTSLFGGPTTYPSVSHYRNAPPEGYACEDMATIHASLGITSPVFDEFIADLTTVLANNGMSEEDINSVAPTLVGFQSQIVTK